MITCDVSTCEAPAVKGVLVAVQPNGMRRRHAVYYACAEHAHPTHGSFARPLDTWQVTQFTLPATREPCSEHDWPAELDAEAACLACGLPYNEFSEGDG